MMWQCEEFEYTENDLYQAVRLPYGNEAYRMTVFLPREGKTVDDVLSQLNGKNWQFENDWKYKVDLKLPHIQTSSSIPLVDVMKELGMTSAFDYSTAEFPYFCDRAVFISNMFQKAVIELDEDGTEAAAVTVIDMTESIPRSATFHANRPFFYIISEQSTGTIFFMGQYAGKGTLSAITSPSVQKTPSDDAIYDLQGRKLLKAPQKGLYIQNGKKVTVN